MLILSKTFSSKFDKTIESSTFLKVTHSKDPSEEVVNVLKMFKESSMGLNLSNELPKNNKLQFFGFKIGPY